MFQTPQEHHQKGRRPIHSNTDTANLLYLYCCVYNLPEDVLAEAETCISDFVNDKSLFIIDCENCWIKYCMW
jgi:hypothetical protein